LIYANFDIKPIYLIKNQEEDMHNKIRVGFMKIAIICVFVVMLFGCATHGNEQIRDQERVSKIQPGITTKAEVTELVGKPSEVTFSDDGDETWKYILTKAQMRASSLIPIVGLFAGGADTQTYTLTVRFKGDVVKSVGKGEMTGGGGSLLDK
jgi:outer membrane protein assembly factor BamE (lipoprotein component of BamABCDE complex)